MSFMNFYLSCRRYCDDT